MARVARALKNCSSSMKCVGLCTTSTAGKKTLNYLGHTRAYDDSFSYLHLVLASTSDALMVIEEFDAVIDHWFIDCEEKNRAFDGHIIKKTLAGKTYSSIEPNALTVDAIMGLVSQETNQSILILGTGNLAFALSQRLKLNRYEFNWFGARCHITSSSQLMNNVFPDQKFLKDRSMHFGIVINTIPFFNVGYVAKQIRADGLFLEVSGTTQSYLKDLEVRKLRLDTSSHLLNYVRCSLNKHEDYSPGRSEFGGIAICSGGFIGAPGDLVVDNYRDPKYVIGISDGLGGFEKRINKPFDILEWCELD